MNIPLPTPPTDNLYKFMALLGAVMLIVALAIPSIRKEELHTQYTEKLDKLNQTGRELQDAVDLSKSPDDLKHAKEVDRAVGFLMGESNNLSQWLRQREEMAAEQNLLLRCALIGGVILALVGFSFWYWNVQRWEDGMKRLEYEKLAAERTAGMR